MLNTVGWCYPKLVNAQSLFTGGPILSNGDHAALVNVELATTASVLDLVQRPSFIRTGACARIDWSGLVL